MDHHSGAKGYVNTLCPDEQNKILHKSEDILKENTSISFRKTRGRSKGDANPICR